MGRAPRRILLLALVIVVSGFIPPPGHAAGSATVVDYATVGRVVARLVDGRTVIVIPVAGALVPKLSEPIRVGRRWRLDLVLEDAKLSIAAPVRRGEGLSSLSVREEGADVRISVEVEALGDYGARRSEEGLLLWIDRERREPVATVPSSTPTSIPVTGASVFEPPVRRAQEAPTRPERTNWVGLVGLVAMAAGAGAALRHVRRNGWPEWATGLWASTGSALSEKLGRSAAPEPTTGATDVADPGRIADVPLGRTPADPRGRSAEIGDAFRVQPDRPASGIAALVATREYDAE